MTTPAEQPADVDLVIDDQAAFEAVVERWLEWLLDNPEPGDEA